MKTAEYGLYGTATSLGFGEQRNNSLTQSLFIMGGGAVAHHADKLAGANAAFKTTGQQANTLLNRGMMHSQQFLHGVANDHRQAYNVLKSGTKPPPSASNNPSVYVESVIIRDWRTIKFHLVC